MQQSLVGTITSITSQSPASRQNLSPNDRELFELDQFPLFDELQGFNSCGGQESLRELLELLIKSELPMDQQKMQIAFEQKKFEDVEKKRIKSKEALYI